MLGKRMLIASMLLASSLTLAAPPGGLRVSADFNGDGFSDVAVGVPFEDVSGFEDAGAVNILYGTATGLTSTGSQIWSQGSPGIRGVLEWGDKFGTALAVGVRRSHVHRQPDLEPGQSGHPWCARRWRSLRLSARCRRL